MNVSAYLALILLLSGSAVAAEPWSKSIEIELQTERAWANADASQPWITSSQWQESLITDVLLTKQGFGLGWETENTTIEITDLYQDFSFKNADWTVGIKPQEWAYAYSDSQLNWIEDSDPMLLTEQYLPFGSWQLLCRYNHQTLCATRLTGWLDIFDWQIMIGVEDHWQGAAALQSQIGSGGLFYIESFARSQYETQTLTPIAVNISQIETEISSFVQANIGLQWTFNQLTLQTESLFRNRGLSADDWDSIHSQLESSAAGLVADAFQSPLGRSQHLLRINQDWGAVNFENIIIFWPDANNSLLNELNLSWEITHKLTLSSEWQHSFESSLLSSIGKQDDVIFTLNFKNGF